jgi:hypothetical protein
MRRTAAGSKPLEFERHRELDDGRTLRGGWMHDPFVREQRKHRAKVNEPDAKSILLQHASHLSLAVALTDVAPPGKCDNVTRDTYL